MNNWLVISKRYFRSPDEFLGISGESEFLILFVSGGIVAQQFLSWVSPGAFLAMNGILSGHTLRVSDDVKKGTFQEH